MLRRAVMPALVAGLVVLAWPAPARAMHISEGILPASWAGLWWLVAIPFVAWGLHVIRVRSRAEPKFPALVALVGAGIFVISCMPTQLPLGVFEGFLSAGAYRFVMARRPELLGPGVGRALAAGEKP